MNTAQVVGIVKNAGQLALSGYGLERGELKADRTWVTQTDGKVEDFLREEFDALFEKDTRIFGEERGWSGKESASYTVIIDPIEGTSSFREQVPLWGVEVGIFREGRPWVGVFNMPSANQFFLGEVGKGAQLNGRPLKLSAPTIPIPDISYLGISSDAHHWNLHQYPGKIRGFGASGCHVAYVASEVLQASLLTRFSFYDIAGTAIILWEAGGGLFYLSGQPVTPEEIMTAQKPRDAVLACHPDAFEETRKYIQR